MARRDTAAAKRFLVRAMEASGSAMPRVMNVDKNPAYLAAVQALKADGSLPRRVQLRQCKYLLLTTPVGLSRNFDDVLIARKCPEHIGFEMFYPGKANGYPPRPFAGAPARALRTPAGAGGTNKQPDFIVVKAALKAQSARTVEYLPTEFIAGTSARSAICPGTARQFGCALWLDDFIAVRRTAAERSLPSALPEWCAGTADQPNDFVRRSP